MNTDFNYIYDDKRYEAAVRNLKATFFDIIAREESMLNTLEGRITDEADAAIKQRLLDLWTKQNNGLDDTLDLVQKLTSSVQVLDSFTKELGLIDKTIVEEVIKTNNVGRGSKDESFIEQIRKTMSDLVPEEYTEEYTEDYENKDESVGQLLKPMEPIESEEVVEEEKDPSIPKNPFLEDVDDAEVVYEEKEDVPEEKEEVTVEEDDGIALPNVMEPDSIQNPIYENPINNVELHDNNTDLKEVSDDKKELVLPKRLLREDGGEVKAIIVNKKQYNKLLESVYTQDALLRTRNVITDEILEHSDNELGFTEKRMNPEIVEYSEEPIMQPVVTDEKVDIEKMLDDANRLYKEGKVDEAEQLYNKIVELNKKQRGE